MNITGAGLRQFLRSCSKQKSTKKIVLGNESGDLDSVMSSLIQSFYISSKSEEIVVPVFNFPAADLTLRPETIAVLRTADCDVTALTFIDQIDLNGSIEQVHLVDHNRLSNSQTFLAPLVVSVVDHHVDESEALINAKTKYIQVVGSACTLIAETILKETQIDAVVARILLSAILSDTFNLSTETDRTTKKDIEIANDLAKAIDANKPTKETQTEIFRVVEEAKYDTQSMSSLDLLRKDYKEWEMKCANGRVVRMGIAAAPLSMFDWSSRTSSLSTEYLSFCNKNNLDILLVMTMFHDPEFHRHLGVFVPSDKDLYSGVVKKLFSFDLMPEKLLLKEQNLNTDLLSFYETSALYSRKKLSPVVSDYIKSL